MASDDQGDGYTAIVNDLKTLWGLVQSDPGAWSRVKKAAKSATTTTGGMGNTVVGMDNTVSGVYTQFQALSITGTAFKFDVNDWLADRKSRQATGRTVQQKADDVYNAVFPGGVNQVAKLGAEYREVHAMASAAQGKIATIQTRLAGLQKSMETAAGKRNVRQKAVGAPAAGELDLMREHIKKLAEALGT